MKIRYFAVMGNGHFPLDMLRYDQCWPLSTDDALNIATPEDSDSYHKHRQVRLASTNGHTKDRWSSFGWSASDQSDRPIDHPAYHRD